MTRSLIICLIGIPLLTSPVSIGAEPSNTRAAIQKSIKLLQSSATSYIDEKSCYSCHHQTLPAMAVALAKERMFTVDAKAARAQSTHTEESYSFRLKRLLAGKGSPGGPISSGYALLSLAADKWPADKTTAALITYLLKAQQKDGHWVASGSRRPPSQGSAFTPTALAVRGLKHYADDSQKEEVKKRVARALEWLTDTKPKSTEDLVFRLYGLSWAGAEADVIKQASEALQSLQREDGGFGQLPEMKSDAYATGSALTALSETGMDTASPAYQKGLEFLLDTQFDDGSWKVKTRAKPIQKYFESGYPHGKDQFISISAGSWATMALLRSLPTKKVESP